MDYYIKAMECLVTVLKQVRRSTVVFASCSQSLQPDMEKQLDYWLHERDTPFLASGPEILCAFYEINTTMTWIFWPIKSCKFAKV